MLKIVVINKRPLHPLIDPVDPKAQTKPVKSCGEDLERNVSLAYPKRKEEILKQSCLLDQAHLDKYSMGQSFTTKVLPSFTTRVLRPNVDIDPSIEPSVDFKRT